MLNEMMPVTPPPIVGTQLNPVKYLSEYKLRSNGTQNITIDIEKKYIIVECLRINDANDRMGAVYIDKGQKTEIYGLSFATIDVNGTTVTLKGTNTASPAYYSSFFIIQLD